MAQYQYKATSQDGENKMGSIQASSEEAAMKILQSSGMVVSSLKVQRQIGKMVSLAGRVNEKDIVVFSREFAIMITSGLPVTQALRILVDQTESPKLKDIVRQVLLDVEAGAKLSDAIERYPNAFSTFYVSMVRSGEASGKLAEMLKRVADQTEKDYNLTRSIKSALIYPAFVFLLLIAISVYVLGWVIPQLKEVFDDFGAQLPIATRILIGASDFVVDFWWLILVLVLAIYFGLNYYIRTPDGRYSWDHAKMRIPIIGIVVNQIATTRFARNLSTLISGDIPIVEALHIVSRVPQNKVFEVAINNAAEDVKSGVPLSEALEKHAGNNMPLMLTRMISVGETTGNIDEVLDKVADFYREEVDRKVEVLTSLLEPVVVVIIGIGVGILIAAVLLPIYNLATVI